MYIPYDREIKSRNNQQDMQNIILYFGVVLYHFYHDLGKKVAEVLSLLFHSYPAIYGIGLKNSHIYKV